MRGFLMRLQGRLAAAMQGRRGVDTLSNALVVTAIVLMLLSIVPGLDLLSWAALALLALAMFRCYSKNAAKRAQENEVFERLVQKPKRWISLRRKMWANRKTTLYFTCKSCGQVLSVPRGKGTLRVVCPKCKTESKRTS